jgi:hypothetical protein
VIVAEDAGAILYEDLHQDGRLVGATGAAQETGVPATAGERVGMVLAERLTAVLDEFCVQVDGFLEADELAGAAGMGGTEGEEVRMIAVEDVPAVSEQLGVVRRGPDHRPR